MPSVSALGLVAPVTDRAGDGMAMPVVFYGDYAEPASRAAFAALKQVESLAGEDVTVVYRHLVRGGPASWARRLAEAAEAASAAGRTAAMHDALYVTAPRTEGGVLRAAARAGLDVGSFTEAWARTEGWADALARHQALAARDGVLRAPTVLVGGAPCPVPTDPKLLWREVHAALTTTWVRSGAA